LGDDEDILMKRGRVIESYAGPDSSIKTSPGGGF